MLGKVHTVLRNGSKILHGIGSYRILVLGPWP